jgi:4'-phosphopantetheinyl transferase
MHDSDIKRQVDKTDDISQWRKAPSGLRNPDQRRVDVWRKPLDGDPDDLETLVQALDDDEQKRARRFKFDRHRRRFVIARATLRRILARYLDRSPASLRFAYSDEGKPYLVSTQKEKVPFFSVSHSNELAVYAISDHTQVGVDVERMQGRLNTKRLAQRFFSVAEYRFLMSLPTDQQDLAFYAFWTVKEAWLKATGKGLAGLSQAIIDPLPSPLASDWLDRVGIGGADAWRTFRFDPYPSYTGALVCAAAGSTVIECFDADLSLPD